MELSWTMCKECSLSVPRMSVPLHRQDLIIYIYQIWLCYNGTQSGAKIQMSKKCAPLWREAHFQVKMHKTHHSRAAFGSCDVEKVHAVVARSTFRSQNVQNTRGSDHFWRFRCRFASIHYTTCYLRLHYTPVHYIYTTLRSSTLHYIKLHYTTLHYTEWHCNTDRQLDR